MKSVELLQGTTLYYIAATSVVSLILSGMSLNDIHQMIQLVLSYCQSAVLYFLYAVLWKVLLLRDLLDVIHDLTYTFKRFRILKLNLLYMQIMTFSLMYYLTFNIYVPSRQ